MTDSSRFFYVVQSGGEELQQIAADSHVTAIGGQELGDMVVRNGIVDWVIDRTG